MKDTKEQIAEFFESCEELKKCKFIMATTKIKDLLKCIVNCPDLYRLFEAVTKNFNYPVVKAQCLVTENDGPFARSYVTLPQTVGERLAFIFCLLVEFDKDTINFNDFLRRFYPEDGSYFASYHAFCNSIIKSLQDAVAQVFKEELSAPVPEVANPVKAQLLSALNLGISEEMQFISQSSISEDDKEGGLKILAELFKAVRAENEELIDALLCGYNYFLLYHRCVSDSLKALIETVGEYEHEFL